MLPILEAKRILQLYAQNTGDASPADELLRKTLHDHTDTWVFYALAAFKIALPFKNESLLNLAAQLPPFRRNHLIIFEYCSKALRQPELQAGSLAMAKAALKKAKQDRPNHPINIICEAEIYLAENKQDERITALNRLVKNQRYKPYVSALLAPVLHLTGQVTSLDDMQKILDPKINPIYCGLPREHHVYFHARLAFVHCLITENINTLNLEHIFNAAYLLNQIREMGRHNSVYYQYMGECLFTLRHFDKAKLCFEKSLKIEHSSHSQCGLALVKFEEGLYVEAKQLAEAALSIEPDFLGARYILALVNIEKKNYKVSIVTLEELLEHQPANILLMARLGSALVASGVDVKRGNSLLAFARQRQFGVGSSDEEFMNAALGVLSGLIPSQ